MRIAVYPGSFDPPTLGHVDIIERSLILFDKVIVAVGDNPQKKALFTVNERIEMLKEVTKKHKNIEIDKLDGLLLDYVKSKKANVIIRGLRAIYDFEFEFQRALLNRKVDNKIETIFIMTKEDYVYLNSSIVKELAMFGGNVKQFVPGFVEKKLDEKFKKSIS